MLILSTEIYYKMHNKPKLEQDDRRLHSVASRVILWDHSTVPLYVMVNSMTDVSTSLKVVIQICLVAVHHTTCT